MDLLPEVTKQRALETRYAKALLKTDKGLGEKTVAIAQEFADSGVAPAVATLLIQTVYAPTHPEGKGQATRVKWFVEAVKRRYVDRLDKAKNKIAYLRTILSELEEVTLLRDTLNGEGASVSFEQAFNLYEMGYDADTILAMISDMDCGGPSRGIWRINRAIAAVKSGRATTIEAALDYT